jgi:beta-lactamase class A
MGKMRILSLKSILFLVCLNLACLNIATSRKENPAQPANTQETEVENKIDAELQKQIEQIALAAKGRVGVSARILETGDSVSLRATERFPMQSVYKLPIAMAFVKQVDEGKFTLEQKIRIEKSDFVRQGMASPLRDQNPNGAELTAKEILKFAVSESDGTASDVLFKLLGGSDAMSKYLSEIRVTDLIVANSEKEIGSDWETQYRNYSTPEAAVKLLRALQLKQGLSDQGRSLITQLMIDSAPGAKRLKGLLPEGIIVAHKTGTSGIRDGVTAATNDIGIINLPNGNHVLIAVFVSDSPMDLTLREETIAKIAKAVWDKWSR